MYFGNVIHVQGRQSKSIYEVAQIVLDLMTKSNRTPCLWSRLVAMLVLTAMLMFGHKTAEIIFVVGAYSKVQGVSITYYTIIPQSNIIVCL